MDQPQYHHDCDQCTFLGNFRTNATNYDLYHCNQSGVGPTVIARFSSRGGDYLSGLVFAHRNTSLGEAKRRAVEKGLNVESSC